MYPKLLSDTFDDICFKCFLRNIYGRKTMIQVLCMNWLLLKRAVENMQMKNHVKKDFLIVFQVLNSFV